MVSYRRLFDSQSIAIARFHVLLSTNIELYIFHILGLHSSLCRFLFNFSQLPILPYCSSLVTYSLLSSCKRASLTPFSVYPLPITSFWHTVFTLRFTSVTTIHKYDIQLLFPLHPCCIRMTTAPVLFTQRVSTGRETFPITEPHSCRYLNQTNT